VPAGRADNESESRVPKATDSKRGLGKRDISASANAAPPVSAKWTLRDRPEPVLAFSATFSATRRNVRCAFAIETEVEIWTRALAARAKRIFIR